MTWMTIGFAVLVGVILTAVGVVWLATWFERRHERVEAMKRAILDKMEAPIDETRSAVLADMERRYKSDKRATEES